MKTVRLAENTGYTTFSSALRRLRWVEISSADHRGRPLGMYRWQVGDRASVHLDETLPWTLVEVELVAEGTYRYGAVVRRFDGVATTVGGLRLGDKLQVGREHFFALWTAEEEREDGEGSQKVYEEGSMRPPQLTR